MYDLTRSKSCSLHTSCIGEPRIPSAQTSLDIGTPIEPKHPGPAPMAFKKMSSEELRLAKLWYDEDGNTPLEISQLLRPSRFGRRSTAACGGRRSGGLTTRRRVGNSTWRAFGGRPGTSQRSSIGDLRGRCGRLLVARGGHVEEG